jgi:hypothetical protein
MKPIQFCYILLSCIAGLWQAWCIAYGKDDYVAVILGMTLGLPFALLSYLYTRSQHNYPENGRSNWKDFIVLWLGMPLSLLVGTLAIVVETRIMLASGFKLDALPHYTVRLLIGEAIGCLAWATCLVLCYRRYASRRLRLLTVFGILFVAVLVSHFLATAIREITALDLYFPLISIFLMLVSAITVIFSTNEAGGRVARSNVSVSS